MIKKGDVVRWKTAARGHRRVKEGEVFTVVPAGISPAEAVEMDNHDSNHIRSNFDLMFSHYEYWTRKDISYLIKVEYNDTTKPKLYWPRASRLKKL